MKGLVAFAFALSSALAMPGVIVSTASGQALCGPDAPASQLRPGGYCDNAGSGKSLTGPVDAGCTEYIFPASFGILAKGTRVDVAATCDCPNVQNFGLVNMQPGDRIHVAQQIPEECQRGT